MISGKPCCDPRPAPALANGWNSPTEVSAIPEDRHGEGRWSVRFDPPLDLERLDLIGEMPLPPYIGRPEGGVSEDRRDYQTVYAANPGAVAAPTAGLHFTDGSLLWRRSATPESKPPT